MKSRRVWIVVIFSLLVVVFASFLPISTGKVLADTDISVGVISGGDINAFLNLMAIGGGNINVWINGIPYNPSAIITAAVQQSIPNGQYSGTSSPGWDGWFNIRSNDVKLTVPDPATGNPVTLFVYSGAGCGGVWGTNDGWPDYWVRRQFIGLMAYTMKTDSELKVTQRALLKVIQFISDQEKTNKQLSEDLKAVQEGAKKFENRVDALENQVFGQGNKDKELSIQKQIEDANRLSVIALAIAILAMIALAVTIYSVRRR